MNYCHIPKAIKSKTILPSQHSHFIQEKGIPLSATDILGTCMCVPVNVQRYLSRESIKHNSGSTLLPLSLYTMSHQINHESSSSSNSYRRYPNFTLKGIRWSTLVIYHVLVSQQQLPVLFKIIRVSSSPSRYHHPYITYHHLVTQKAS